MDHQISIIADVDPNELKEVDPSKLIKSRDARRKYREWLVDKEVHGKFTWTIGLWGTQAKADEVGLSLKDYWQQIINACFLDEANPVEHWKKLNKDQVAIKKKLNDMMIETVHVTGPDADIHFNLVQIVCGMREVVGTFPALNFSPLQIGEAQMVGFVLTNLYIDTAKFLKVST